MKTTYTPQEERDNTPRGITGYLGLNPSRRAQRALDRMQLEQDNLTGKNDYEHPSK